MLPLWLVGLTLLFRHGFLLSVGITKTEGKSFGKVNIMSGNIQSIAAALTFIFSLSLISSTWAYIDPNTTHTVFNALGMSLVAAGVILNILFWPILFLRKKIKAQFQKLTITGKAVVLCGFGLLLTAVVIFLYRLIF